MLWVFLFLKQYFFKCSKEISQNFYCTDVQKEMKDFNHAEMENESPHFIPGSQTS